MTRAEDRARDLREELILMVDAASLEEQRISLRTVLLGLETVRTLESSLPAALALKFENPANRYPGEWVVTISRDELGSVLARAENVRDFMLPALNLAIADLALLVEAEAATFSDIFAVEDQLRALVNELGDLRIDLLRWSRDLDEPGSGGTSPDSITREVSIVRTTGYTTFYQSDFQEAADAAASDCAAWRDFVESNSEGSLEFVECFGPEQIRDDQGHWAARYSGKIVVSFGSECSEFEAPLSAEQSWTFSTGYSTYYESDVAEAMGSAQSACQQWVNSLLTNSEIGRYLLLECTPATVFRDGHWKARVEGSMAVVWPSSAGTDLIDSDRSFVFDTGYSTFYESDFLDAARDAESACASWLSDLMRSSAPTITASCGAAEPFQEGTWKARVAGSVVFAR